MTDLVAFLGARYDEDERQAGERHAFRCHIHDPVEGDPEARTVVGADPSAATDPERCTCRVRRELHDIAAKRRIVERCEQILRSFDDPTHGTWCDVTRREKSHAVADLCDLAQPFRAHPDFDPAWRAA